MDNTVEKEVQRERGGSEGATPQPPAAARDAHGRDPDAEATRRAQRRGAKAGRRRLRADRSRSKARPE